MEAEADQESKGQAGKAPGKRGETLISRNIVRNIANVFKSQDENCLFMNIYVPIRGEEEARRAEEEGEKGEFCWQNKGGGKLGNPDSYSESRK